MSNSSEKPTKPYPDFPLFPHATKRWAKKIKGRMCYFGPWQDWKAALELYQEQIHDLQMGRKPRPKVEGVLSVGDLCNQFLAHREAMVDNGELARQTWLDYKSICAEIIAQLGRHTAVEQLNPADFAELRTYLGAGVKLVTLKSNITRAMAVFNFAHRQRLIPNPVDVGESFKKPSVTRLRAEKQASGAKSFTIEELTAIYAEAGPQLRCFILLGLNGGLGNGDIGRMQPKHINGEWIDFPRPKTAIPRRFPLWAETAAAIKQTGHMDGEQVFKTKYGGSWFKGDGDDPIAKEFRKLCEAADCHVKGRGFYALRHQFRSIARAARDREATDSIMGHVDQSTAAHYIEFAIEDERLQAVVDHVREWVKPMWEVGQ